MRSVLIIVLLIAATFAWSVRHAEAQGDFDVLFEDFDARPLTIDEKRFLQTALAFQGYYNGLLDGRWGASSQQAIERYSTEKFSGEPFNIHIATLVVDFLAEVEEKGWQVEYLPAFGISIALPSKGMVQPILEGTETVWRHNDRQLEVRVGNQAVAQMSVLHQQTLTSSVGEPYSLRNERLWVTGSEMADGSRRYARSDLINGQWTSTSIAADAGNKDLLQTIASSLAVGPIADWRLPPPGRISATVELTARYFRENPDDGGKKGNTELQLKSTGSGFFVTFSGIVVTNAHVVRECEELRVGSTVLEATAGNDQIDLAILKPVGSMPVAGIARFALRPARLNSEVTVVGFPLRGVIGGINFTRGTVSGSIGMGQDISQFQVSAAVQPGNSGGPVLDESGGVVGVVVSKLNAQKVSEATGDIPQNVNFAVRGELAKTILAANNIPFYFDETDAKLEGPALAEEAQKYTVAVECWG